MKLVVLLGRGTSRQQEAWEAEARRRAHELGWEVLKRSYDAAGSRPGEQALSAQRAQNLYELVHEDHAFVVSFVKGMATVRSKKLIPLGRFLRYKAAYRVLSDMDALAGAIKAFEASLADPDLACGDANDPRVLPLHLFAPKEDFQQLDQDQGRKQFRLPVPTRGVLPGSRSPPLAGPASRRDARRRCPDHRVFHAAAWVPLGRPEPSSRDHNPHASAGLPGPESRVRERAPERAGDAER